MNISFVTLDLIDHRFFLFLQFGCFPLNFLANAWPESVFSGDREQDLNVTQSLFIIVVSTKVMILFCVLMTTIKFILISNILAL